MSHDVIVEQTYAFPPERVWRALTDSAAMAEWLMPNDFLPRVGHKFQFRGKPMPGWRGFVECEVIEVVPPIQLAFTWVGDDDWKEPSIVRWTLEPVSGGTHVRLVHSNLQGPWATEVRGMLSAGWNKMLKERLLSLLERLANETIPSTTKEK